MGRAHADRGNPGGAGHARRAREGPLYRLLELFRLAPDEGARRFRREHRQRFISQQIHYTLEAREAEYELIPISLDQGLGVLVWSPLAGGLLSGKHRRDEGAPEGTANSPAGRTADPR